MFTKRSWGAFGTAIVGLGIGIVFSVILVFAVNQYTSAAAVIAAVLVGMAGLFLIFLGIRIAGWDKRESPELSWIDPDLDYHFYLTFRGREQEIRDFSAMEEVLTAFEADREAWSLRIVPPMGTLFGWKGYYDDREGMDVYVTEIALAREEGIQRWALSFDDSYVAVLNRELKKLIVDKKKPSLDYYGRIDGEENSLRT